MYAHFSDLVPRLTTEGVYIPEKQWHTLQVSVLSIDEYVTVRLTIKLILDTALIQLVTNHMDSEF